MSVPRREPTTPDHDVPAPGLAPRTSAGGDPSSPPAPPPRLPALLSSEALHARLRPHMTHGSWRNWLYSAIAKHGFPQGIRLGERCCAWREDEVLAWIEGRQRGGRFDGRRGRAVA